LFGYSFLLLVYTAFIPRKRTTTWLLRMRAFWLAKLQLSLNVCQDCLGLLLVDVKWKTLGALVILEVVQARCHVRSQKKLASCTWITGHLI
jgi:hypothetical protein